MDELFDTDFDRAERIEFCHEEMKKLNETDKEERRAKAEKIAESIYRN